MAWHSAAMGRMRGEDGGDKGCIRLHRRSAVAGEGYAVDRRHATPCPEVRLQSRMPRYGGSHVMRGALVVTGLSLSHIWDPGSPYRHLGRP